MKSKFQNLKSKIFMLCVICALFNSAFAENNYVSFNGTTGSITVPHNAAAMTLGSGDFTISIWLRPYEYSYRHILTKVTSGLPYSHGYSLRLYPPDSAIGFNLMGSNSAWVQEISWDAISQVSWSFLVLVKQSASITVYVNGTESPSVFSSYYGSPNEDGNNPMSIGFNPFGVPPFYGDLDDLRIYKAALDTAEIKTLYADGGGLKYAPGQIDHEPNLVMEFDEGSGSVTSTTIPGGAGTLTGTLSGGAIWQAGGVPFVTNTLRPHYLPPTKNTRKSDRRWRIR